MLKSQALEQSPGLRHMLRSPPADAPSPGEAAGPERNPSPDPDPAASPSTPAAYGGTPAPGLPAEADPGASRLRQASHGAASATGRGSVAGEGEHRVGDRVRHSEGDALGGRGGGGQAVPGSPSVHPDGSTGRERARGGAGGGQGSELEAVVLGHHMVDFWTNVCVCHTLIVEAGPDGAGPPIYQVRSRGSTCAVMSVVQTRLCSSSGAHQPESACPHPRLVQLALQLWALWL